MRVFSILSIVFTLTLAVGQDTAFAQTDTTLWLGLVPEVVHTEGELAGMTTYRLYLYTPNENDFLVSCSGDDENPLILESTAEPAWFQHEASLLPFPDDINPIFYSAYPNLVFDSWLTIGAEDNSAVAVCLLAADPNNDIFDAFMLGNNIVSDGQIGNAWAVLPNPVNVEAFSGADRRVLVAQLTTAGQISGQMQVQVFLDFEAPPAENEFRVVLPIVVACNDPEAINFDPAALNADGCLYPEVDDVNVLDGPQALHIHPNPAKSTVTISLPESLDASRLELQARTLQGQLAGSWVIQSNVAHIDVSGMAAGHYLMSISAQDGITFAGSLVVSK